MLVGMLVQMLVGMLAQILVGVLVDLRVNIFEYSHSTRSVGAVTTIILVKLF